MSTKMNVAIKTRKINSCPRILFGGGGSGSGKTLITCAIMTALKNRGLKIASYKCGPDYIDPRFHEIVVETKAGNLDPFFMDKETMNYRISQQSKTSDLVVMEGVMGYYDGIGSTIEGSSWDIAVKTNTPAILIFNGKGMSITMLAQIRGILQFQKNHRIAGIILNQVTKATYENLKPQLEEQCEVPLIGYVPVLHQGTLESRHLGLVMPSEIKDIKERLNQCAAELETTLNLDLLLTIAKNAESIQGEKPNYGKLTKSLNLAVAKDEAFCFLYRENLDFLREIGVTINYFSPLRDKELPKGTQALLLPGGYPELYGETLEKNKEMRKLIKEQIQHGLPYLAECGGYLYLCEQLEDHLGQPRKMVGLFPYHGKKQSRLSQFGYIQLSTQRDGCFGPKGSEIRGHEFHYYQTFEHEQVVNGDYFQAKKPKGMNQWMCGFDEYAGIAGFPHLSYLSNPSCIFAFFQQMIGEQDDKG